MKRIGLCHVCGKPARNTCSLCGRPVCDDDMDRATGACKMHSRGRRAGHPAAAG